MNRLLGVRGRVTTALAAATLVALPPLCAAQPAASPARRVGVVLSGGSAKGLAHIGVLQVLEDAGIPVDVVTGTSMGSMVGGLYAIGYGGDQLEVIARTIDWDKAFSDPAGPAFMDADGRAMEPRTVITVPLEKGRVQLPSGLIAGQEISAILARLTWPALGVDDFHTFPIPFAAVATDIESGEAVVLDRGSLPLALRASMALPGVFRPAAINGRLLVDGGIARNLPSAEAKALGADILICSDVSEPPLAAANLRSFFDVLLQTVTFQMEASTLDQRTLCDVLIQPDIKGLSSMAFERAGDWIERGADAARAALAEVTRATAPAGARPRSPRPTLAAARQVTGLDVRGLPDDGRRFAVRVLNLDTPRTVTAEEMEAAVDRLYRTGAFDRVSYRLEHDDSGSTLVVEASQRSADSLGFGFRYDSRFKASLLFDATLHNLGRFGSTSRLGVRLGEQFELSGQHLLRAGGSSGLITGFDASYVETPIDLFSDEARVAEVKVRVADLSAFVGARVGRRGLASLRVTGEHAQGATRIAAVEAGEARTYYTVSTAFAVNTLDRPAFARRGFRLLARTERADRRIGSGGTFWQHLVNVQAAVPLTSRLAVTARAVAGAAGGNDLPFHYQFFLGGTVPSAVFHERQPTFPGLRPQQRSGLAVQLVQAGLQFEPAEQVFVGAKINVGNTADRWRARFDRYARGYEMILGAQTFVGPVEIVWSGDDFGDRPTFAVRLGHRF